MALYAFGARVMQREASSIQFAVAQLVSEARARKRVVSFIVVDFDVECVDW